jgi:hypothetical protein
MAALLSQEVNIIMQQLEKIGNEKDCNIISGCTTAKLVKWLSFYRKRVIDNRYKRHSTVITTINTICRICAICAAWLAMKYIYFIDIDAT